MAKKRRKKKKINIFEVIISILLMLTSLILFYFINKMNVLKTSYVIIIGVILLLLYGVLIFKIFRNKTKIFSRVLCYLVSILLIVLYSIGIRYLYVTIDFIENMTGDSKQKQNYSVIVLKDSEYSEISHLNDKKVGFLSTNPNLEMAKKKFDSKTELKYTSEEKNITDLVLGLNNKELDAIVLDTSMLTLLEENQEKIKDNIKVIFDYTIYINRTNKNKKVNVKKDPFVFYISGSDTQTTLSDTDRSDVNIIAVINPKSHKILLVNIPRDVYVQLHGITGTKDKLTHAGLYGIDMSVATIEDLLEININYYAKVSFDTLINSVDVIGGIDITSEVAFTASSYKKCKFSKGTQHVNGACALAFARERKKLAGGDYARGLNQQQVITAMINKLSDPSVLTKYNEILNAIDGSFKTNMTYDEITTLVKSQLSSMSGWSIESTSLGGQGGYDYTYSMGDQKLYVTYPSYESIENAQAKINEVLYNQ